MKNESIKSSINILHCPRCGQSFHAENVLEEHSIHDFVCSVCSFGFQMRYDPRRHVYFPLIEASLLASSFEGDPSRSLSGSLEENRSSSLFIDPTKTHSSRSPFNKNNKISDSNSKSNNSSRNNERPGYDPIAVRLKQKWQDVLEEFNASELHAQFIDLCQQLGRLEFAKERYDYLKQALGDDPEVNKRIRQIEMKSLQAQEVLARITNEDQKLSYWRRFGTLFLVAILLALTGTLLPGLRWVSFLGVFILAGLLFNRIKK